MLVGVSAVSVTESFPEEGLNDDDDDNESNDGDDSDVGDNDVDMNGDNDDDEGMVVKVSVLSSTVDSLPQLM